MEYYNMCRICLSDVGMTGHYLFDDLDGVPSDSNLNIADVLVELTNLTINTQDNLPQTICTDCFDSTKMCYEFRQKCIRGADLLTERANLLFFKQEEESEVDGEDLDKLNMEELIAQTSDTEYKDELEDNLVGCTELPGYYCEICQKTLKSKSNYNRHFKEIHPGQPILNEYPIYKTQDDCDEVIPDTVEENIKKEVILVDVEKSHVCLKCMKKFKSKSILSRHMKTIHPIEENEIDKPTDELREYVKFVSFVEEPKTIDYGMAKRDRKPEALFFCDHCNISFSLKPSLQRHMRNFHSGSRSRVASRRDRVLPDYIRDAENTDGSYYCGICKTSMQLRSSYVRHVRLFHTGNKIMRSSKSTMDPPIFYCVPCSKTFTIRAALIKHNKSYHPQDNMKKINECYFCTVCEKTLWSKSSYDHHMKIHAGTVESQVCDVCGKVFYRRESLKDHMNTHTDNRPYKCKVCGATFRQSCSLDMHRQLHEGKKHKCDDCDARFITKALLMDHKIIVHEGIRRFQCDMCPNSYFRKSHLKSHQYVHRPRLFPCNLCGRDFTRYESLRSHRLSQHMGKPFTCTICMKKFMARYKLKKHLLIDHSIEEPVDDLINEMVKSTKTVKL